jgi:hypothetical protein
MTRLIAPVAGLSFRGDAYPANVYEIERLIVQQLLGHHEEGLAAVLIPEPDNAYDANAMQVHVPAIDQMVGYVPRQIAARMQIMLRDGYVPRDCMVYATRIHPDHPGNPGLDVAFDMVKP